MLFVNHPGECAFPIIPYSVSTDKTISVKRWHIITQQPRKSQEKMVAFYYVLTRFLYKNPTGIPICTKRTKKLSTNTATYCWKYKV
mgnify:CR=1 FL=1